MSLKILVGGVGNVLCGDDAVGPHLALLLEHLYRFTPEVRVVDFGTPGLDFVVQIAGLDVLILIDAADNRLAPGSLTLYAKETIMGGPVPMRLDPHQPALKESLLVADIDGQAPKQVYLLGVTGQSYNFGESLSEAVCAALPPAIERLIGLLEGFGVHCERTEAAPDSFQPWWLSPSSK